MIAPQAVRHPPPDAAREHDWNAGMKGQPGVGSPTIDAALPGRGPAPPSQAHRSHRTATAPSLHRTLYLSCGYRAGLARSAQGMRTLLGQPNYSYLIAMEKFRVALQAEGCEAFVLDNPAIIGDASLLPCGGSGRAVHMAFYPPESVRLLKPVRNVLMFAWEFSRLRTEATVFSSHAFAPQAAMLGIVDAVWTPSRYAAHVLKGATDTPVAIVPAPIAHSSADLASRSSEPRARQSAALDALRDLTAVPLGIFPRHQAQASKDAAARQLDLAFEIGAKRERRPDLRVYLTVLNPHDARKGLLESIEAFCRFAQERDDVVWIIKTGSHDDTPASINTRLFTHQIAREADLAGQYFSDSILICNDALTSEQLHALYMLADFYLCTSHAEGQNFPLQEAMATGVVPISVDHTAMADYISNENAIVLPSVAESLPPAIARKYLLAGAKWFVSDMFDVYEGLRASAALSPPRYLGLAEQAAGTIARDYSGAAVCARIEAALR